MSDASSTQVSAGASAVTAGSLSAVWQHFLLTLRLNFRSPQAIIYGYFVPILFLLAFGSVFRADTPVLAHEMGQLLTLTILGGACFGLPTALVAERERGVWRRYRLLPVNVGWLALTTLISRIILVTSGAALQIALARLIYGTPWPLHPWQATGAFLVVTIAFLGLGLLVAALANDVPAVQALGQCIFLPMVMIGGVGVPLVTLPTWAQYLSAFMPGRYAVEMLQFSYGEPGGLDGVVFPFVALTVIGLAALIVGLRLFRWDNTQKLGGGGRVGLSAALAAWAGIGVTAIALGRVAPLLSRGENYHEITAAEIDSIRYNDLPEDGEIVSRFSAPLKSNQFVDRLAELDQKLKAWAPGRVEDEGQRTRNLLSIAAIADVEEDPLEGEIARDIFDLLKAEIPKPELEKVLAWIILAPDRGQVVMNAQELGFRPIPGDKIIRERSVL
ncbi:MAG TPA: ABC transporter permease, partial [Opitutaceae bacterium]